MPSGLSSLARIAAAVLLAFAATSSYAKQARTEATLVPQMVIEGLGKGTAALNGPWQFHLGDDLAWAKSDFDSSGWEQLSASEPWGEQGHANVTGFAWYRCSLAITPAPGVEPQFSLLVPKIDDAYEVYWNGSLIGRNGKLPPYPVWYVAQSAQIFKLGEVRQGVLAVRVWKAPLLSDDSGKVGGFEEIPLIGATEAIVNARAALELQWLRSRQFLFGESLLCALVALLSFLIWWRNSARWLLFWMTGYALVPPLGLLLLNAHILWPYALAMGIGQPLTALGDISLWFLLLWLLPLHENRALVRFSRILAYICLFNGVLDGILVAISWQPKWMGLVQSADAVSAVLATMLEAFPLILACYAFVSRRQLDSARWLVAVATFVDYLISLVYDTVKQGRQFTDWSIASRMDSPLFVICGSAISLRIASEAFLLITIVYAVYHSVREDQRRQDALEREKLELMRESNRMRHYAEHDDLTGLWNHRIVVERLREEMDRSRRDGTPLSAILVDVDHFKKINDSFGHLAGDLVLKEISSIFMRTLRPYDCVGRYGGEEFLMILPGCGMEGALIRAEQLRLAVQSAVIMDGETILQVTASFGVASEFPSDYEAEGVIRAVDEALYRAKNSGRNCVIHAEWDLSLCIT